MSETLVDQEIICRDCKKKFGFPVRDQEFFAKMQFTPPVRCKPCRDIKKANRDNFQPQQQQAPSAPIVMARRPAFEPAQEVRNDGGRRRAKGGRDRDRDDSDW